MQSLSYFSSSSARESAPWLYLEGVGQQNRGRSHQILYFVINFSSFPVLPTRNDNTKEWRVGDTQVLFSISYHHSKGLCSSHPSKSPIYFDFHPDGLSGVALSVRPSPPNP